MKLRFGIDEAIYARIREDLDARCEEPPVGLRLVHVYLDTPDSALAERGMSLRFRRAAALGLPAARRPWRRQLLSPKGGNAKPSKKLGIKRLKQRLDAVFDVRIERWTWQLDDHLAAISLDRSRVATGRAEETFCELRLVCKRRHEADATATAVSLGATCRASLTLRERGRKLMRSPISP